jgi:hypothetical protein
MPLPQRSAFASQFQRLLQHANHWSCCQRSVACAAEVLQPAAAAGVICCMHAWPSAAGSVCRTAAAAPHNSLNDMWQPQLLKKNELYV